MTTQPPKTLAECSGIVTESFRFLRDSGLTPEQGYHLGQLVNAYLFASKLATKLGNIAEEATDIAVKSLIRDRPPTGNPDADPQHPPQWLMTDYKNRVTPQQIEDLIDIAESQEHVFWDKELVTSYRLPSGFTVTGRGSCVDPANFDLEIGRQVCREDAIHQLWQLEGYLLQNQLYDQGVL